METIKKEHSEEKKYKGNGIRGSKLQKISAIFVMLISLCMRTSIIMLKKSFVNIFRGTVIVPVEGCYQATLKYQEFINEEDKQVK